MHHLRHLRLVLAALATLTLACNRTLPDTDCDGLCEPFSPEFPGVGECHESSCAPTFGECFVKSEIDTCAQACAAQGSTCAQDACAGATYMIFFKLEYCENLSPDGPFGPAVSRGCDEPIDWQFNDTVQCCCEQQ